MTNHNNPSGGLQKPPKFEVTIRRCEDYNGKAMIAATLVSVFHYTVEDAKVVADTLEYIPEDEEHTVAEDFSRDVAETKIRKIRQDPFIQEVAPYFALREMS